MAVPTMIAAILLIVVGVTGYLSQDPEKASPTALIPAFFGIALVATWDAITTALGVTFTGTNAGVQGIWDPPPPGASGP